MASRYAHILSALAAGILTLLICANVSCQQRSLAVPTIRFGQLIRPNKFYRVDKSTVLFRGEQDLPSGHTISTSFSGAIIGREGNHAFILTVAHGCVGPLGLMDVSVVTEERLVPATVVKTSYNFLGDGDVCLVTAEVPGRALPVAKKYTPFFGDKVFSVGSPAGVRRYPVSGYVADAWVIPGTYLLSMPVSGGLSGSPVVFRGKLIGIVTMEIPIIAHGSVAESLDRARALLSDVYTF